jgi:hypothetical protein
VTHLRKVMLEELQPRNLSPLTAECYLRAVREFDQLGPEQIRQYQAHRLTNRKLDANTVSQHLSGLRFFYNKALKRNLSVEDTPPSQTTDPFARCAEQGRSPAIDRFRGQLAASDLAADPVRYRNTT